MQLDLRKVLAELHRVSEGPLVGSYLAQGSAHEDGPNFIHYQKLSDVVGIGPHHCKLLASLVAIKLSDAVWVADGHDVEHTVEGRTQAFAVFVPDFE